jgi:hypothetical protein
MNSNLPNGTLLSDISPDECPKCEGAGVIEAWITDDCTEPFLRVIDCPVCSGMGCTNVRAKR